MSNSLSCVSNILFSYNVRLMQFQIIKYYSSLIKYVLSKNFCNVSKRKLGGYSITRLKQKFHLNRQMNYLMIRSLWVGRPFVEGVYLRWRDVPNMASKEIYNFYSFYFILSLKLF